MEFTDWIATTFILCNQVVESNEVLAKLMVTFVDVTTLIEDDDISPANAAKLRAILGDNAKTRKLKIELAATADCMEPFAKAT